MHLYIRNMLSKIVFWIFFSINMPILCACNVVNQGNGIVYQENVYNQHDIHKQQYNIAVRENNIGCNLENAGRYYEAVQYYISAVNRGYTEAKYNLARAYGKGRGVNRDDKIAFRLYHDAAVAGIPQAQHNLGCCYINGIGVKIDNDAARYWFEKAASNGITRSQMMLLDMDNAQEASRKKNKKQNNSQNIVVKTPKMIDVPDKL